MTVHLSVPITLDRKGRFATVERSSAEEITQAVRTVLLTAPDTRLTDPEVGAHLLFSKEGDLDAAADAVRDYEPRATPVLVAAAIDQMGDATVNVRTGA